MRVDDALLQLGLVRSERAPGCSWVCPVCHETQEGGGSSYVTVGPPGEVWRSFCSRCLVRLCDELNLLLRIR